MVIQVVATVLMATMVSTTTAVAGLGDAVTNTWSESATPSPSPVMESHAYRLPADDYPLAKCLDGSQGMYYWRSGSGSGLNKFYIHQEGGGFCKNPADCARRSFTYLGSTRHNATDAWKRRMNLTWVQPIFDTDPEVNPLLANWNHVYIVSCDGGYFAGQNSTQVLVPDPRSVGNTTSNTTLELHFAGKHILDAVLFDLVVQRDLEWATDIVFGGCSAGAISTYAHIDYVAEQLYGNGRGLAPGARVVGMADSGFYPAIPLFVNEKEWAFHAQNMTTLSQDCLADNEDEPHRCLFAEVNSKYVGSTYCVADDVLLMNLCMY